MLLSNKIKKTFNVASGSGNGSLGNSPSFQSKMKCHKIFSGHEHIHAFYSQLIFPVFIFVFNFPALMQVLLELNKYFLHFEFIGSVKSSKSYLYPFNLHQKFSFIISIQKTNIQRKSIIINSVFTKKIIFAFYAERIRTG